MTAVPTVTGWHRLNLKFMIIPRLVTINYGNVSNFAGMISSKGYKRSRIQGPPWCD